MEVFTRRGFWIHRISWYVHQQLKIKSNLHYNFYFSSANLGGVLGLCTGFSLITAVELIYWFTVRILHDYCRRNKINPQSSNDEESQKSGDGKNEPNEKNECDCKNLQSKTDVLDASNAELKASVAEINASNAAIKASNAELQSSVAEIKASNAEIKVLLEGLLRGKSSQ